MKSLLKTCLMTVLTLLLSTSLYAQTAQESNQLLSPDAQISLITCSPGTAIYELFGHSGMRVVDPAKNIDVTFNYGLFDFNQDSFVYRFVRGKTDYQVGVFATTDFLQEYVERGSAVTESVLNLTQNEKDAVWLYLMENIQPENRTYRYNFIFNNCATKLRDIIDQNVSGIKSYPDISAPLSFRSAVKMYTQTSPWSQFGFDLCLGRGMDRDANSMEKMFLPELLCSAMNQATVTNADTTRNLVSTINVLNERTLENPAPFISPLALGIILCVLILLLSAYGIWKNIDLRWLDATIFSINGLMGCIILFLILFSKHPFTFANFNIIWTNPFMFIPLLFLPATKLRKFEPLFYAAVSIILVLFLLIGPILEQDFNDAVYPFAIVYLLRAASYVIKKGYHIGEVKNEQ